MHKEIKEYLAKVDGVSHITLNPKGPGVVRIHLLPPEKKAIGVNWVVIINGQDILPLTTGWAVLLREFIENASKYDGENISDEDYESIIGKTVSRMHKIFPKANKSLFKEDLKDILSTFEEIARGVNPTLDIGFMSLREYAKYMSAPHRMDLMLSSMQKGSMWNCNQKCLHCYAGVQNEAIVEELSTASWKQVIDVLRKANVPQLTFTGGEPTLREDLVELVEYSKWFVTRLNTNGIRLSKSLSKQLYDASLDAVQVTCYSDRAEIHNILTGSTHFEDTINGIKNALEAGLNLSVNTPLCQLNKDYVSTIRYLSSLGVKYFTCSGIIMTGEATSSKAESTYLNRAEMRQILLDASSYCQEHGLELSFTSPGWVDEEDLRKMRLNPPTCGACLSNMAIAPNGDLIPCQSYLEGTSLGNIFSTPWKKIWNDKQCKSIRKISAKSDNICQLAKREVR